MLFCTPPGFRIFERHWPDCFMLGYTVSHSSNEPLAGVCTLPVLFFIQFKFHWILLLRVQLRIRQHWFRGWLGAEQATRHYLNQCWPRTMTPHGTTTLIARLVGPTWGPPGADRTQVGPMLAPRPYLGRPLLWDHCDGSNHATGLIHKSQNAPVPFPTTPHS